MLPKLESATSVDDKNGEVEEWSINTQTPMQRNLQEYILVSPVADKARFYLTRSVGYGL